MIKQAYHQLILIVAFLSCVITSIVFGRARLPHVTELKIERSHTPPPLKPQTQLVASATARDRPWSALTSGENGWHFELFTPPAIAWDASSHAFKLTRLPATELAEGAAAKSSVFQSEVDGADGIVPRLQLLGYFQRDGGAIAGIFQNLQTSEIRVAQSGTIVDDWRVLIEGIELEMARITNDNSGVQLPRARALVRDKLLGSTYPLSTDAAQAPSTILSQRAEASTQEDFSRDG